MVDFCLMNTIIKKRLATPCSLPPCGLQKLGEGVHAMEGGTRNGNELHPTLQNFHQTMKCNDSAQ